MDHEIGSVHKCPGFAFYPRACEARFVDLKAAFKVKDKMFLKVRRSRDRSGVDFLLHTTRVSHHLNLGSGQLCVLGDEAIF